MRIAMAALFSLALSTTGLLSVAAAEPQGVPLGQTHPVSALFSVEGKAYDLAAAGFDPAKVEGATFTGSAKQAVVLATGDSPVTIPVKHLATNLRFLQTLAPGKAVAAWRQENQTAHEKGDRLPERLTVAQAVVRYADGREVTANIRYNESVGSWLRDWWNPVEGFVFDLAFAPIAWQAKLEPGSLQSAVVYATNWPNPRPEVAIESVTLKAAPGLAGGRLVVFAVSTENTPHPGATYFVAPDGSDAAPGTFDAPWGSLAQAANTVKAGDAVTVRGGTYRPTKRIAFRDLKAPEGQRTVIVGYPGETATFDCMDALWDRSPDREQLASEYFPHDQSMIFGFRCEAMTFKNLHIVNSRARGFGMEIGADNEVAYCFLYKSFGPGLRFDGQLRGKLIGNSIIRGTSVTMAPGEGDGLADADGPTSSSRRALAAQGGPPMESLDSSALTDCVIAYNEIGWGDKECMLLDGLMSHLRIHHNYIHDAWNVPWATGIMPNGYGTQEDIEIDHNVSTHVGTAFGVGTEGGGSGKHMRIHHNVAWDCHWAGTGVQGAWSKDATLSDIAIYNNTFYHNGYYDANPLHPFLANEGPAGGIPISFAGRDPSVRSRRPRAEFTGGVEDVLVANNLIVAPRDYALCLIKPGDPAASRIAFTHNLTDLKADSERIDGTHNPAWRSARDAGLIVADPKLTDPAKGDYRPKPGSLALGQGVAVGDDGKLVPDGKPVDIGAFPGFDR
jgi:hypothetical protein